MTNCGENFKERSLLLWLMVTAKTTDYLGVVGAIVTVDKNANAVVHQLHGSLRFLQYCSR
jgi:hypothetical protein